jgi:hypothetical protein
LDALLAGMGLEAKEVETTGKKKKKKGEEGGSITT